MNEFFKGKRSAALMFMIVFCILAAISIAKKLQSLIG
jgi:hypothetical protein